MNCLKKWSLIVGICSVVVGFANPVLAKVAVEATIQPNKVQSNKAEKADFTLADNFETVVAETYVEETIEVEEVVVEEYTEETVEVIEEYTEEVVVEEYVVEEYTEETIEVEEVVIEEYSE